MRDLLVFAAIVGGVPLAAFLVALWATAAAPLGPPRAVGFAARIEVPAAPASRAAPLPAAQAADASVTWLRRQAAAGVPEAQALLIRVQN